MTKVLIYGLHLSHLGLDVFFYYPPPGRAEASPRNTSLVLDLSQPSMRALLKGRTLWIFFILIRTTKPALFKLSIEAVV